MGVAGFTPTLTICDSFGHLPNPDEAAIINEPMLFSAEPAFAFHNGGPLTKQIIELFGPTIAYHAETKHHPSRRNLIIDTRVHMLMPGMYPAIPGWHCDHTPRFAPHNQPDPRVANADQQNWTLTLSVPDEIAPTEFWTKAEVVHYDDENVWKTVSVYINRRAKSPIYRMPDGTVHLFSGQTLHRATAATKRGWRFFFRMSEMFGQAKNQIRRQAQVYVDKNAGW